MSDWERIVREHGALVYGTAWRILGHAADTEDVVQEVFLEAHRWLKGQQVRNWAGFLRRMSACRALDRLRQRKPSYTLDGLSLPNGDCGPQETAIGKELAERLRQALALLPEREAEVFCLRYFEELSYQRIGETLHISTGAVAMALHKARGKLEAALTVVAKGD